MQRNILQKKEDCSKHLWSDKNRDSFILLINFGSNLQRAHYTQKRSFPVRNSSVNVTKSAVSCGFCHIY